MGGTSRPVAVAVAVGGLLAAESTWAAPQGASVVLDPTDDAVGFPRDYVDIVESRIDQTGHEIVLSMEVAGPVPEPLPPPTPGSWTVWDWSLDVVPNVTAVGYPFGNTIDDHFGEVMVVVRWDGAQLDAVVVDRRPLLDGEPAIEIEIPFYVGGTTIEASLDTRMIELPSSFRFWTVTADAYVVPGEGFKFVDVARVGLWPP